MTSDIRRLTSETNVRRLTLHIGCLILDNKDQMSGIRQDMRGMSSDI